MSDPETAFRERARKQAEARQRAAECAKKIDDVLEEFDCYITTSILSEPVGDGGSRALLSSRWGVFANMREDPNA